MVCAPRCFAFAAALLAITGLHAQTVYKSVDEKGNVTYSESPPDKTAKDKMRSTTELPIDTEQNVMPAFKPIPVLQAPTAPVDSGQRVDEVAAAQAELEAAEARLQAGTNVQPGDFMGKAGGGVGPSPERLRRLEELQKAVDEARENLERARGGSP